MGDEQRPIYTVGHSTHESGHLTGLLKAAGVEEVWDVRTQPHSKWNPQHNRENLAHALQQAGIRHRWEPRMGGRPENPAHYDPDGHVRYDLIAASPQYQEALGELLTTAETATVAVLCSEENPNGCHRSLLVVRTLLRSGVTAEQIIHLRGDGSRQQHEPPGADTLFSGGGWDELDPPPWRSTHPVRRHAAS